MGCKYSYYKEEEKSTPRLYCKADNGYCIKSKLCQSQDRFVHLENFEEGECFKFVMEEQKNIPINSYYVTTFRPSKKGNLYLYVVIEDRIERISTTLKDIKQNYVYLKEGLDGYQVSLIPFEEEKTYTRKKSNNKKNG